MTILDTLGDRIIIGLTKYLGTQPDYVFAVSVLVLSAIVATATSFLFAKIVLAMTAKTKSNIDDKLVNAVKGPLSSTIFIIGIAVFIQQFISFDFIINISDNLILSLLIAVWGLAISKILHVMVYDVLGHVSKKTTKMDREFLPLFDNIGKIVILLGVLFAILGVWNINVGPLVASAGIAGFALAFAAKDTIANFFGGISIYLDRPYKLGDYIILDSGERGEVKEIGVRSTKVVTRDDFMLTIPNSVMANAKITNESAPRKKMRIRIPFGVAYGSNLDKVEKVLLGIAKKHKEIVDKDSIRVRFTEFRESAIGVELRFWIERSQVRGRLRSDIIKEIHKTFKKERIKIPYPQRDVHMRK